MQTAQGPRPIPRYREATGRPLYCLAFLLPLILFFQVGTAWLGHSRLLAQQDLHKLLGFFGATAPYVPALLVLGVLVAWHLIRRDPLRISPGVLLGMAVESAALAIPLLAMMTLIGRLAMGGGNSGTLLQSALLATGAGIYEEFIFRLALLGLAVLIFVKVFDLPKSPVLAVAVAVTSLLFALYHVDFAAGWGDFSWARFIFRAAGGAYLAGVFLLRGYGITVGAHACYNLLLLVF